MVASRLPAALACLNSVEGVWSAFSQAYGYPELLRAVLPIWRVLVATLASANCCEFTNWVTADQ